MDVKDAIQHQAGADGIASRGGIADVSDNGGACAQLVAGDRPAGFNQYRIMLLHFRGGDDPVHVDSCPDGKAHFRVKLQIICPVQVLDIHQELGFQKSIPHAYKPVRSSQERTGFIGMVGQELAGFGQGRGVDIIKFRQGWMR